MNYDYDEDGKEISIYTQNYTNDNRGKKLFDIGNTRIKIIEKDYDVDIEQLFNYNELLNLKELLEIRIKEIEENSLYSILNQSEKVIEMIIKSICFEKRDEKLYKKIEGLINPLFNFVAESYKFKDFRLNIIDNGKSNKIIFRISLDYNTTNRQFEDDWDEEHYRKKYSQDPLVRDIIIS